MDDTEIRRLLDWPAEDPEPPSAISLDEAKAVGRRRLRRRRLVAANSVLAVAAAAAFTLPLVGSPGPAGDNPRNHQSLSGQPHRVPRSFNPLVPYASFGWLPAGAKVTTYDLTRALVSLETGPGRTQISLAVDAPGRCHLSGPVRYRFRGGYRRASRSLACQAQKQPRVITRLPLTGAAPEVRGDRAWWSYWQSDAGETGLKPTLIWQLAPGSWAVVSVGVPEGSQRGPLSAAVRAELRRLAESVRFGGGKPFRYAFRLTHIPAGWTAMESQIDVESPRNRSFELTIGPAGSSTDFVTRPIPGPQVDLSEAVPWSLCSAFSKMMRQVKLGRGVSGTMIASSAGTRGLSQSLCIHRTHGIGLAIYLSSGNSPASAAGYPSVSAVYRALQFPNNGTTDPRG
jgi:hypothetical protein